MDDEKNFCCFGSFMRGSADHRRLFFQGRKKALTDEEILENISPILLQRCSRTRRSIRLSEISSAPIWE